ncbi:hypothetical protein MKX03_037354, partial [Papaver bracteatum]
GVFIDYIKGYNLILSMDFRLYVFEGVQETIHVPCEIDFAHVFRFFKLSRTPLITYTQI